MPGQLALVEPVLEGHRQGRVLGGQGDEAFAQVPSATTFKSLRSRPLEPPSSATDTTAVSLPA